MADMMWAGRFSKKVDETVNAFNSSIAFDGRMYKQDIQGSIAHAAMLGDCGIISKEDSLAIIGGLKEILADIENGTLEFDMTAEDIHMFIEAELTKRLGDVGKRLHTSRSRNDQVAVDIRLYLRQEIDEIYALVKELAVTIYNLAKEHTETVMPGYTHLQRAQPITFAHHLLAYVQMLVRDLERLKDTAKRMNYFRIYVIDTSSFEIFPVSRLFLLLVAKGGFMKIIQLISGLCKSSYKFFGIFGLIN